VRAGRRYHRDVRGNDGPFARTSLVNEDRGHGAMPKLYGAPAYARPKVEAVPGAGRPFDPDDLPLEAHRTAEGEGAGEPLPEMQATAFTSTASAAAPTGSTQAAHRKVPSLIHARPFRLKRPGGSGGSGTG
jgi:hypothetical protein